MCNSLRIVKHLSFVLVLTITGCLDSQVVPPDPETETELGESRADVTPQVAQTAYPPGRSEAFFYEVTQAVPGFAGVHREGDRTVISLTDLEEEAAAKSALQPWLNRYLNTRGLAANDVVVRTVAHDYRALTRWFEYASANALVLRGVNSVTVSERGNRVVLGVSDLGATAEVEAVLATGGIPSAAVGFRLAGPARSDEGAAATALTLARESAFHVDTLLGETFDPTPGGVGGLYENASEQLIPCTFGFSAYLDGGQGDLGFVTASHCSATIGGVDGSVTFRQNGDSNPVGIEQIDHSNVCGSDCKWADAAWYEFVTGRDPEFAWVARTQDSLGNLPDARTIDNSRPRFQVSGTVSNPVEGDSVFKIGTVDGWTTGEVQDTCVNFTRDGFLFKCQDIADYDRDDGDSGGPILLPDDTRYIVWVIGIHTAEQTNTGWGIFSAIANMEVDFGDASGNEDLYAGPGVH